MDLGRWLTAPSVLPWVGAAVAAAAALAVGGRAWLKNLRLLPLRLLGAAAVWLAVVGIIYLLAPQPEAEPKPTPSPTPQPQGSTQAVAVSGGQVPGGVSADAVLVVSFVPSEGDPHQARDFSCDLLLLGGKSPEKVEVRAQSMAEFDRLLTQQLRRVQVPPERKEPAAVVIRDPFPGEGVLKRVREKVQAVLPEVSVSLQGGPS